MDLFEAIRKRYSVRSFRDRPLDETVLQTILGAANDAPSAGNLQAYEVVLVRDAARKRDLARASGDQWFVAEAPVALVFVTNPARNRRYGSRGADLYTVQDAAAACSYAQLAATAHGLGTCWVGAFDEAAVARIVGAPPGCRPVAILPVGWPAEEPRPRVRRSLADLVHSEQYRRAGE